MASREVRIRTVSTVTGREVSRRVTLVRNRYWVMVCNLDYPRTAPFVMTREEWEGLPLE